MSLTAEGEVFLGYARQIFSLHREALDRFKEPGLEGEVLFGLPEILPAFTWLKYLQIFRVFIPESCCTSNAI